MSIKSCGLLGAALLICILAVNADAETLKMSVVSIKGYSLVGNKGSNDGVEIGDVFNIATVQDTQKVLAKAKVLLVRNKISGLKLLQEPTDRIQAGYLLIKQDEIDELLSELENEDAPTSLFEYQDQEYDDNNYRQPVTASQPDYYSRGSDGGCLGKHYLGFSIGNTILGDEDLENLDYSILSLGGNINIPVGPTTDFVISLSYSKSEAEFGSIDVTASSTSLIGGFNFHFGPEQNIDPFIGLRFGIVRSEAEASLYGYSADDYEDSYAFAVGAGLEVDLSNSTALRPTLEYDKVEDVDDIIAGMHLSIWFNKMIFISIGSSYALEGKNITYSGGIGLSLWSESN